MNTEDNPIVIYVSFQCEDLRTLNNLKKKVNSYHIDEFFTSYYPPPDKYYDKPVEKTQWQLENWGVEKNPSCKTFTFFECQNNVLNVSFETLNFIPFGFFNYLQKNYLIKISSIAENWVTNTFTIYDDNIQTMISFDNYDYLIFMNFHYELYCFYDVIYNTIIQYINDDPEKYHPLIKNECFICFETKYLLTTQCKHSFCMQCRDNLQEQQCPICRRNIVKLTLQILKKII